MFKNLKCQRKIITITSAIVTKLKKLSLSRPPSTHSVVDLTLAIVHFDRYNVVTIDDGNVKKSEVSKKNDNYNIRNRNKTEKYCHYPRPPYTQCIWLKTRLCLRAIDRDYVQ